LSIQDARENEIKNEQFEKEVIQNFLDEQCNRREKFRGLLLSLNKLCKFDKDIKEIYDFIEPIIEAYCSSFISYYEVDEKTYDKTFETLKTIRTNKDSIDMLKQILRVHN
jgi:hypothetical protein